MPCPTTSAAYKATALLGAYSQELAPESTLAAVYHIIGGIATGHIEPEAGLVRAEHRTAGDQLPFAYWKADQIDSKPVLARIALQSNYDDHLEGIRGSNLSHGTGSVAYLVASSALGPVVVKKPFWINTADRRAGRAEHRLSALLAGTGIVGYEQALARAYRHGAVGTSFLPGESLRLLGPDQLGGITSEHLGQAVDTVIECSRRWIVLDWIGPNTNYDPRAGIGFFDAQYRAVSLDPNRVGAVNSIGLIVTLFTAGAPLSGGQQAKLDETRAGLISRLLKVEPALASLLPAVEKTMKEGPAWLTTLLVD